MLRREQVTYSRNVFQRDLAQTAQSAPVILNILIAKDARSIAVYDSSNTVITHGDTLLWARDEVKAGDIYTLNCPCMSGILVDVQGQDALATIVFDDRQ